MDGERRIAQRAAMGTGQPVTEGGEFDRGGRTPPPDGVSSQLVHQRPAAGRQIKCPDTVRGDSSPRRAPEHPAKGRPERMGQQRQTGEEIPGKRAKVTHRLSLHQL